MKRLTSLFFLLFILVSSANAYVDMSDVPSRANDVGMTVIDYEFAMSILGTLNGTMLGLFLWKTR